MAMKASLYRSRSVNVSYNGNVEWIAIALLCLASLLLGFRVSREVLDIAIVYNSHFTGSSTSVPQTRAEASIVGRVHVGRHQILIRKWPHPHPLQTMAAHRLIELLQKEQRFNNHHSFGVKRLLVITPICFTSNVAHLITLIHTLRVVPYPLTWIVVEGGGDRISDDTASLLSKSHLSYFHLNHRLITGCIHEDLKPQLRMAGLRFVREQRLDGIILFADEVNTYSLEFFDEVQKVQWAGALPFALLEMGIETQQRSQHVSIQGPACNSTGHLSGWHISVPHHQHHHHHHHHNNNNNNNNNNINNCSAAMEKMKRSKLEWMGFVINAKVLMDDVSKPSWIREWHEWGEIGSSESVTPLDAIKDEAYIQPLGRCGQDVLLWCLG